MICAGAPFLALLSKIKDEDYARLNCCIDGGGL